MRIHCIGWGGLNLHYPMQKNMETMICTEVWDSQLCDHAPTCPASEANLFNHCIVSISLWTEGFTGMGSSWAWLLVLPSERLGPGRSQCWEWWSVEISEPSKDWSLLTVIGLAGFLVKESCNGSLQTGHVDCFLSHTSMQVRWKLWPHLGIILSTSFSSYSPKQIEHWASSTELKASRSNFIVGIAAMRTGSRPLTRDSGCCSRSTLDSIS